MTDGARPLTGLVIATCGDKLSAELPACRPVLSDRMGNEITRLTAVKVLLLLSLLFLWQLTSMFKLKVLTY